MAIIRFTDNTLTLRINGVDLTESDPIMVSFRQNGRVILIPQEQVNVVDSGKMIVTLTQTDTRRLAPGTAKLQINLLNDDMRSATDENLAEATIKVVDNQIQREIHNE